MNAIDAFLADLRRALQAFVVIALTVVLLAAGLGSAAAVWWYDRQPAPGLHLAVLGWKFLDWSPPRAFEGAYALGRADQLAEDTDWTASAAREAAKASAEIAAKDRAAQAALKAQNVALEKKVSAYVTKTADAHCVVTAGFVRLHDAALVPPAGQAPGAAGADGRAAGAAAAAAGDVDAPSGLKLSDVERNDVANAGICLSIRQQLVDLQAWERSQESLFPH